MTMKTFKEFYEESMASLQEAFSTYQYRLPDDRQKQLFDFYMLVGLQKPENEKLKVALEDALTTVTTELKKELLRAVMFAVSAEFRHIFAANKADKIKEFFNKHGAKSFIKNYANKYQLHVMNMGEWAERDRKDLSDRFKDNARGYQDSYNALKYALKKDHVDDVYFMEMAAEAFVGLHWQGSYGGEPWANICKGWLMLEAASTLSARIIAIDHVYDLQHNTDTVFNKLKSYYVGGYSWIKAALDKKFHIKDMFEIYDDVSAGLKSFAAAIIKDTTGQTLEMWLRNKGKKTSASDIQAAKNMEAKLPPKLDLKKGSSGTGDDEFEMGIFADIPKLQKLDIMKLRTYYDKLKAGTNLGVVDITNMGLTKIPKWFRGTTIYGNFVCYSNELKSLENCPYVVKGVFDASYNPLHDLNGIPYDIDRSIVVPYYFTDKEIKRAQAKTKMDAEKTPKGSDKKFNIKDLAHTNGYDKLLDHLFKFWKPTEVIKNSKNEIAKLKWNLPKDSVTGAYHVTFYPSYNDITTAEIEYLNDEGEYHNETGPARIVWVSDAEPLIFNYYLRGTPMTKEDWKSQGGKEGVDSATTKRKKDSDIDPDWKKKLEASNDFDQLKSFIMHKQKPHKVVLRPENHQRILDITWKLPHAGKEDAAYQIFYPQYKTAHASAIHYVDANMDNHNINGPAHLVWSSSQKKFTVLAYYIHGQKISRDVWNKKYGPDAQ